MAVVELTQLEEAINADELNKEELLENLRDTIGDHKTKYTSKDKEALKWKGVAKNVGWDHEKYESTDKFVEEVKGKLDKVSNVDNLYGDNSDLTNRLALMEKKLEEKEIAETKLKATNNKQILKTKLDEALGKKLKASKYVVNDLINNKSVAVIDGEVVFKDGDDIVLFSDGIKGVLKDNEELLLSDQNPGSNSSNYKGKSNNTSKLSVAEINKMSPAELQKHIKEIKKLGKTR